MRNDSKSDTDEAAVEAVTQDSDATRRRPSPGAQAASRARRIAGRPQPGPRPAPAGSLETDPGPAPPVSLAKGSTGKSAPVLEPAAEADGEAAANTDAETDAESLRRRLDRVRWIPAGVLGAAVVVLAALCAVLGHGVWWGARSAGDIRGQVLAAAKTCTANVSSYDYRALAQSKTTGLACATGKFKTDYATAMDTVVAKEAPATKTTQTLQVANAGIEQVSSDGKQWTVLIYGQHKVTNSTTGVSTPRLDKLSVRVTMDKVGGKWLIGQLNLAAS